MAFFEFELRSYTMEELMEEAAYHRYRKKYYQYQDDAYEEDRHAVSLIEIEREIKRREDENSKDNITG